MKTHKIINNTILSGVIGTIIGLVLTTLIENISDKTESIPNIWILIVCIFIITLLAYVFNRIESQEEYREQVMKNMSYPIVKIEADAISDFATSLVKKSKYVRVVGTARQDAIINAEKKASSIRYLQKLEDMLKQHYSSELGFQYYRVVPSICNDSLNHHIQECQNICKRNKKNMFGVKYSSVAFDFGISYQIFDETDMLIIVDNPSKLDPKKDDNALCLWTKDPEIINVFVKRFDSAWERNHSDALRT